jgi:hypothetical protein
MISFSSGSTSCAEGRIFAGRVVAFVLDQPPRAFGQPEHQAEHDQRGDGGAADLDAPVDRLRRPDNGRHDDADADPHLEGEHEPAAEGGGRELGDVHRDGLRPAADREPEQDPA